MQVSVKQQKKTTKSRIILLTFGILTLLALGILLWVNSKKASVLEEQVVKTTEEAKLLFDTKEKLIAQIDSLQLLSNGQSEELSQLKTEVESLSIKEGSLAVARRKIQELTQEKENYLLTMDVLQAENEHLETEAAEFGHVLQQERSKRAERERDYELQLNEANHTIQTMAGKINEEESRLIREETSAFLPIYGLEVQAVKLIGQRARPRSTRSAKQTDQILVTFYIGNNKAYNTTNTIYYLRIVAPDGTTISGTDQGGGTFSAADGTNYRYTTSHAINYEETETAIAISWEVNDRLSRGAYRTQLFQNGNIVGEQGFVLK